MNLSKIRTVMLAALIALSAFTLTAWAQDGIEAIMPADKAAATNYQQQTDAPAAAPANDNFANAQTLTNTNNGIIGTSNIGATKEPGEPTHAHYGGGASVWYRYLTQTKGSLTIKTVAPAFGGFDTVLAVYVGDSVNQLSLVVANDDFPNLGDKSSVTFAANAGSVYWIAVDTSTSGNGTLPGNLTMTWTLSNIPANDNFANAQGINSDTGSVSGANVGAAKEPNEPNHAGDVGGKSIWFRWTAPSDIARSYTFTTNGSRSLNGTVALSNLLAIYTGQTIDALTAVAANAGFNNRPSVTFQPTPGATYYIAVDGIFSGGQAQEGTIILSWNPTRGTKAEDFDGDGKADITVFRPTTGFWYSLDSESGALRAAQWGKNGDKPVYSDFDQDGKPDYAVYRPDAGSWFVLGTYASSYNVFQFGASEDVPVSGSYLTSTQTTPAVFRPSSGTWYISDSINRLSIVKRFGQNGDIPVPADYDGNGKTDIAVFRPSNGYWYILLNSQFNNPNPVIISQQFGLNGDKPVAADYDKDGRADIAVYRPSNGTWYVLRSSNNQFSAVQFGNNTDKPQPADYDGDGKADFAVFRPSSGMWYLLQSSRGFKTVQFGANLDTPTTTGYIIR